MGLRATVTRLRRESSLRHLEPLWQRLQPLYDRTLRIASGGSMEFVVNGDRLRLLYEHGARWQHGGYEPHIHRALMKYVTDGSVFFDVGAHVGFHTLAAALRGARVRAFEAAPDSAMVLREHVRLNGFDVDVEIVEAAVLDSTRGTSFFVNEATMSASISRQAVDELSPQAFTQAAQEVFVPSVTLDSFGTPDLVKIDVEGAELQVLRGARDILRSNARLLVEIHPLALASMASSERELLAFAAEHGREVAPLDAPNHQGIYHAWLVKR